MARDVALRSPTREAFRRLLKHRAALVGGVFIILLGSVAILADNGIIAMPLGLEVRPLIAPKHYATTSFLQRDLPPGSPGFLLGSDYLGRDL
ncbi:MAG: hypothetical protein ABID40_05630, partial [Candidatus Bipolaricaulota bacterium]